MPFLINFMVIFVKIESLPASEPATPNQAQRTQAKASIVWVSSVHSREFRKARKQASERVIEQANKQPRKQPTNKPTKSSTLAAQANLENQASKA